MCKLGSGSKLIDLFIVGSRDLLPLTYLSQDESYTNWNEVDIGVEDDYKGNRKLTEVIEVENDISKESTFNDSDYSLGEDEDEQNIDENIESAGVSKQDKRKKGNEFFKEKNDLFATEYDKDIRTREESSGNESNESLCTSESSENDEGHETFKRFRPEVDMDNPKFVLGMVFTNAKELRAAINAHRTKKCRNVKFVKNDKSRIKASCEGRRCSWFVYVTHMKENDTCQIRSLNNKHKCGRDLNHKHLTSRQLCRIYMDDFRLNMYPKVSDFQTKVHSDYSVNVSRKTVYKAFSQGRKVIEGQYKDLYKKMWDYCEEIKRSNPWSTVVIETEEDAKTGEQRFLRLYICLDACRRGFLEGCRPVIGLDGCHLKGPHPGILLSAISIDANYCIFPVVYVVVETENKSSWSWFINMLIQDFEIWEQEKWVIITDKQKGLCPAINEMLLGVEHRHCV